MTQISFRRARETDLPSIVAMLADDELGRQREDTSHPLAECYRSAFNALDADPNQFLAVVTEDAVVVGTLQLTFIPGLSRKGAWRGQIEAVRIAGHRRGSGLGRQMFQWAIAQCRERGCNLVQLTTDRDRLDAHRFYEQLGFTAGHIGYKLAL
ncbi:GNAT superfamily N-acetyltransferase [Mesorhizobium soli]|jgi:GNAT superfamily N-acetyltransferase|uniref:GNAT family N-acetyltransferase n=1 Tax=Pseudaminobacter soli (ex Li et al. 2025) TaxID=1295366 RepID=UPI002474A155|nr:GNAT family N-acetyltransferase [Mesorhizobium soli]MDH6232518.1 GNAT superfamily N-acetyltransferase [Mesorhizobium soli]